MKSLLIKVVLSFVTMLFGLIIVHKLGGSHIAQYPVRWTAQTTTVSLLLFFQLWLLWFCFLRLDKTESVFVNNSLFILNTSGEICHDC